ncbi:MAG: lysophospholipase [Leptonema sp. (in: bacteria)]
MKHFEFLSTDNKTKLVGTLWEVTNPKATVVWIHGFAEHRLRYQEFASYLNQNQINFFGFDLRGHGDSSGKRGLVLKFEDYLDDVDAAILQLKGRANSIFLCGHSMGGLILARYLETRTSQIPILASIFSCPFLGLGMPVPGWKRKLAELLAKPFPGLSLPSGLNPKDISHDESIVEAYKKDPKVFGNATARWFIECLKNQTLAIDKADQISVPTQVMQGLGDKIVNPEKTKEFYTKLKVANKNFIGYEDLYHEILNESPTFRKKVYEDILEWFKKFL